MTTIKLINMKNVTFIIWIFVVLCAGCGSSTSVVQDEVSMTKKQLADIMIHFRDCMMIYMWILYL